MKKEDSMLLFDFSRTLIIGCAGSGKTELSKKLAKKLNLPLWHLDKILMKANWENYSLSERYKILDEILCQDAWLIDGMWLSTLQYRLPFATTVIYLDLPTRVCFNRAKRRYKKTRGMQTDDHATGCIETFDKEFQKYIKGFNKKYKKDIEKMLTTFGMHKVIRLKSPFQVWKFTKIFKLEN
ncbi:MAG: topology modulation protein [Clostridia bacterium]|nr:topology modulation protein [Clostridia bacterium]